MKTSQTYSYDIFDTCLVRACGAPMAVFDLVAKRILGITEQESSLWLDFVMERRSAEVRARKKLIRGEKEEVTLEEIYEECDFSTFSSTPKSVIMQTEMEIEKAVLMPVCEMKREIDDLRNQGNRILFVSDMYLPEDFIRDVLCTHGLMKSGDSLYVSSTTLKSKASGNLFRWIREQLQLDYKEWTHKGDNKWSDYKVPQKLGIHAKLIRHRYSFYEDLLQKPRQTGVETALPLMAGISKAIRLSQNEDARSKFAADFIAPIYVPFVLWILSDAQKRGIKNLFFLARDSLIFYRIAQCFSARFPRIQLSYIYVSRKSLYLAGLSDVSLESVCSLFLTFNGITFHEVLDRLQMSDYPVWKDIEELPTRKAVEALFDDESFVREITQRHHEQQQYCKRYFEEVGLTEQESAIIDLRGTRKCCDIINTILESMDKDDVFGYYLESIVSHFGGKGYRALSYKGYDNIGPAYNIQLLPPELFEQYFSLSDHERTCCYAEEDGHVVPVYDPVSKDIQYRKSVFTINADVCCHYAKLFNLMVDNDDYGRLCREALAVYHHFYMAPSKEYLEAFEGLSFADSNVSSTPLLEKNSMAYVIKHRQQLKWWWAVLVYNSPLPDFFTWLLRVKADAAKIMRWK